MYYVVQESLFNERNYDNIFSSLDRLDLKYEVVKIRPFTDEFDIETDRKDVFVFGGTKFAKISKSREWIPGSLLNDNHDYVVYSNEYKENLLNYDSKIITLGSDISWDKDLYFIRPCKDDKLFTGSVFDKESWLKMKDSLLLNDKDPSLLLQIATPKNIQSEYRLFIVGDEVVTGSQYTMNGRYYTNSIVDSDIIEFAESMMKIYKLADCFVMDIARTSEGLKIVECGCINCAGFYDSDLIKLIISLEEFYKNISK